MANDRYRLSNTAKEDLIRIHHFGVERFGIRQADKYFNQFFRHFDKIADNPFAYEAVDHIRVGYRRCPVGSDTIYYRIENGIVEVMSIIGRQDFGNSL